MENTQVGNYRIGTEIGRGSFAVVFKAHNTVCFVGVFCFTFWCSSRYPAMHPDDGEELSLPSIVLLRWPSSSYS